MINIYFHTFHGTPWGSMDFIGTALNSMGFHGAPWTSSVGFHGVSWDSLGATNSTSGGVVIHRVGSDASRAQVDKVIVEIIRSLPVYAVMISAKTGEVRCE